MDFIKHSKTPRATRRCAPSSALLAVLVGLLGTAAADDHDLQFWFPVQVIHPFGKEWTVSMQTELRLQDSLHDFSELVLKPAVNYHFNDTWTLSGGYKYIDKYHEDNEQDLWQELHYNWMCKDLVCGLQLRLEERFISGINGVLPRVRLLGHVSHPIADSAWYTTGWAAVRFNLADKGAGPVSGFEQSRVFLGLGHHLDDHVKLEFGYLWRYERERDASNKNDHVIHLQLVIHTDGKLGRKPRARDIYR